MRIRAVGATLAVAIALGAIANGAPAAARRPRPVHPVLGDWEGAGPHGLRMSFEFVRHAGQVVVLHLALGLPYGCRSAGNPAWDASAMSKIEYVAPGTVLHGPFPPLGATQFELIVLPTKGSPFPVSMEGSFSSSRHGVLTVPGPSLRCARGGWPRMLRFALAAARRVSVADGLWTGTVAGGPSGASGTVQIRVIDGGRVETDFQAAYTCPPYGSAHFEIGPLPTVGSFVAADGSITGFGITVWSGRFLADRQFDGNFTPIDCGPSSGPYTFTAVRTGP